MKARRVQFFHFLRVLIIFFEEKYEFVFIKREIISA